MISLSSFTSVCTVKILQNRTFSSQCPVAVAPGHWSDHTMGMGNVLQTKTHSTETNLATEPLSHSRGFFMLPKHKAP